jgi:hypothetical protein
MESGRVSELERKLNRLQRVTAMLAIGFGLLLVWRLLPGPETIDAREFRLRDAQNRIRGGLMMLEDGRPVLRLNDVNGRANVMLYLDQEQGGGLRFTSAGTHRAQLLLTRDGWPELRLADASGRTRTFVGLERSDRPAFLATDSLGSRSGAPPQTGP